jgi:hypothetical protein
MSSADYSSGSGHPLPVNLSDEERHGSLLQKPTVVMCTRRGGLYCHNDEVLPENYEEHLKQKHKMYIDPVQERLMWQAVAIPRKLRGRFVWAPFPEQIPHTLYQMHLAEILKENRAKSNLR